MKLIKESHKFFLFLVYSLFFDVKLFDLNNILEAHMYSYQTLKHKPLKV